MSFEEQIEELVERLDLEPIDHEGGWFRRIHTGEAGSDGRPLSTTIYALFTREQFSALHRLNVVEQFFFVDGDPFEAFRIDARGKARSEVLSKQCPHLVFEAGCWFGGRPVEGGAFGWTLMSCVVTPGFDWDCFELGERAALLEEYPGAGDKIRELTR